MPTRVDYDVAKLGSDMVSFATHINELGAPNDVLDSLHTTTQRACSNISVLGAVLWPVRRGDGGAFEKGKTVFLHESAPEGWWEEWLELSRVHPSPSLALARLSLAPFIRSEMMTMLQPLGIDRWAVDLVLIYGIRDGLVCPVGGRWLLAYWSRQVLSQSSRMRLGRFFSWAPVRRHPPAAACRAIGQAAPLTARELAVLRLISDGRQIAEAARLLGIGDETVRTHLKKAQGKLGAKNRAHVVAQAMRLHLIP